MSNFTDECEKTVLGVQRLLSEHTEWWDRFAGYAKDISSKMETIKNNKRKFRQWTPLYLYTSFTEAKTGMLFNLRYAGQAVAALKINKDRITISTKKYDKTNTRDFQYTDCLGECDWASKEASKFRRHFSDYPIRTRNSSRKNEEHRIESALLAEFSKKARLDKTLHNIQPVKIAGVARFQMPTPLCASNMKMLDYSGKNGGGIDILARVGSGRSTKLCVMEVKDENETREPASKVLLQALAYATFLRELLRSSCGETWWKLFGFTGGLPKRIEIPVACVMPFKDERDISFAGEVIDNSFPLHFLYFKNRGNAITCVETSLSRCRVR